MYYKQIFIKSEADLPKERGYYFVHLKKNYERLPNKSIDADYFSNDGDKTYVKSWMNAVDFYLQPEPEMTEKVHSELIEALETALRAIHDIVHQLPMDERLADYNLDYCEIAEEKIKKALNPKVK